MQTPFASPPLSQPQRPLPAHSTPATLVAWLLSLVVVSMLAGCGPGNDASPPAASETPTRGPDAPVDTRSTPPAAQPPAEPRAAAAPAPVATTPEQKTAVVRTLNTLPIAFDARAGTVSANSLDSIAKAARALASTPDLRVQIALPAGSNEALARQRAEALKVQLIINGVSPGAIDTLVRPAGESSASTTVSFTSVGSTGAALP